MSAPIIYNFLLRKFLQKRYIKKFIVKIKFETRAVVGQRSSPAGYILYCNIFIIKKFKMYNNNKTQTHHEFLLRLK